MAHQLPQRPHTAIGNPPLKHDYVDYSNPFHTRKSYKQFKEARLSGKYPRKFENVETFNLNPGYRLSRSAGKVYVRINPNTFFDHPKPETPPKKLTSQEMESLLKDLQEQVSKLSTFLEEERLRHGGTRKRANLDLQNLEKTLKEKHINEINHLLQKHEDEKVDIMEENQRKIMEFQEENRKKYDLLTNEYRLLKASFKNYKTTLQEEMNGQWKIKLDELEWEKRHAIDNAVDDCKRMMEDKFSMERQEIRKEFRAHMNEIMRDHRNELEMVTKKLTGGDLNIEDLKNRSFLLDEVNQELEDIKVQLKDEQLLVRKTKMELSDARVKFSTLENQFEERVASVEDKHRSRIESLTMERADARLLIARSCENLQSEKIAREIAEAERKEAAIKSLEAKIKESQESITTIEEKPAKRNETIPTTQPSTDEKPDMESKESEPDSDVSGILDEVLEANKCYEEETVETEVKENSSPRKTKPKRVSTAPTKIRHPLRFTVPPTDKKTNVTTINIGGILTSHSSGPDQAPEQEHDDHKNDERPKSPSVIH